MKAFVTLLLLVQTVVGRPQADSSAATVASSSSNAAAKPNVTFIKDVRQPLDGMGSYNYDIQLSDGTKLMQQGSTVAPAAGENETSIVIKGSYSYIAPDGTPVMISYIADKDGYQATGSVIPSPPSPTSGNNATSSSAAAPASSGPAQGPSAPLPSATAAAASQTPSNAAPTVVQPALAPVALPASNAVAPPTVP